MADNKWQKDTYDDNSIIWSNKSDKAKLRVIAKRFETPVDNMEWEMRPEVDGVLGADIRLPNKKCAVSMVSCMKKILSAYLRESYKTGNTYKETIRIMNEKMYSGRA